MSMDWEAHHREHALRMQALAREDLNTLLAAAFDEQYRGDMILQAVLWDGDTNVLAFVQHPPLRTINLWFHDDDTISVISNNGPDVVDPQVLWGTYEETS